ncbi:hypothetical protein ACIBL3_43060 [Kribbella sp. NPDC050124]|uniref:hypothetical protein n=1 Tax=Kribbella sp. NPDC050124 TaxID=3364114 RepID=UPI0037AF8FDE
MTQKHHPLGSGFTAASTADEVLRGMDLSGTNVVVTGGHAGIGLETTRALSNAGAAVTVGARVVNVTSGGHRLSDIRWDDPQFNTGYDPLLAYGQSKTANVLFAVELDRRWADESIRGYAVHPSVVVTTNLGRSMPADQKRAMNLAMELIDDSGRPIIDPAQEKKTAQQGASASVFAATSPLLAGLGGVYLMNNDISPLDEYAKSIAFGAEPVVESTVVPHAPDPDSAHRLWELSEQLIKSN